MKYKASKHPVPYQSGLTDIARLILFVVIAVIAFLHYQYVKHKVEPEELVGKASQKVIKKTNPKIMPGMMYASIPQTYSLDLESGKVRGADKDKLDLWWQAKTKTHRCLCPYIRSQALIADLPAIEFDQADFKTLVQREYTEVGIEHRNDGGELKPGLTFAVKTTEGNYAKVRVVDVGFNNADNNYVVLEWEVFNEQKNVPNTDNITRELREIITRARQSIRAKLQDEAASYLARTPILIDKLPEADLQWIQFLYNVGRLYWSLQDYESQDKFLLRAANEIRIRKERSGNSRSSHVSWRLEQSTYRFLGISYRDQKRYAEAIPWLERAIAVGKTAGEEDHNAVGRKYMAITGDQHTLATVLCFTGDKKRSDQTYLELKKTCKSFKNPESVYVCNLNKYRC